MARDSTTTSGLENIESVEINMDGYFIGGMVCVALGVILIIIAIVYLTAWCCRIRKTNQQEKLRRRHLEHMRYLEEYSIKTGDSPNDVIKHNNNATPSGGDDVFKWDTSDFVNLAYVGDDTLEKLSQKRPKLDAHINGSSSSFGLQRAPSRAGSSGSRPASMTSHTELTADGDTGFGGRSHDGSKQGMTASLSNGNRAKERDRLADEHV